MGNIAAVLSSFSFRKVPADSTIVVSVGLSPLTSFKISLLLTDLQTSRQQLKHPQFNDNTGHLRQKLFKCCLVTRPAVKIPVDLDAI